MIALDTRRMESLQAELCGEWKQDSLPYSLFSHTAEAIRSYHDLNGGQIIQLDEEPSALEFSRYLGRNVPFVIRDGAREWPAVQKWGLEYLKTCMDFYLVRKQYLLSE